MTYSLPLSGTAPAQVASVEQHEEAVRLEIAASKSRSNHTGEQDISTIAGLEAALDGKATAAQGDAADTALQPGDLGTAAAEDVEAFATAAQGGVADTATQPAQLAVVLDVASLPHDALDFYGNNLAPLLVTMNGQSVLEIDDQGRQLQRVLYDFHGGGNDAALSFVMDDSSALLQFDSAGKLMGYIGDDGAAASMSPGQIPYIDGTDLRAVGAEDTIAASLGGYTALATAQGNELSVRAVINRPSLDVATAVSAANGLMIPDFRPVLHMFIGLGQSLAVGSNSNASMVLTSPVWADDALMLTVEGGSDVRVGMNVTSGTPADVLDPATITGFEPLKAVANGIRGQTIMESFSTTLAQSARDIGIRFRTLSAVAGVGGTTYANLKKGSQIYANMLIAVTKAKALAEAEGWRLVVDAALVKHGESDAANAAYAADLIEWQGDVDADVKAITGQLSPVHFIIHQPSSSSSATFNSVKAMLDVHNTTAVHHLAGADYPFGAAFAPDYLHFTGPGYQWIGEVMARAARQVLWTAGNTSKIVQITAAARTGTSVVLDYEVPVPPLVFDTATLTERDVKGFRFFDGSGEITVNAAAITGPAQVTLTLGSTPSGSGEYVTYAMREQSGPKTDTAIPRGNLRDSASDISTHAARPLWNWAVHQHFDL